MLTVEFHCHTSHSKDSLTTLPALIKACNRKGIDRVVISDHNTIAGAVRARALDPERVIVGEEIATQAGELLAAFVQEEVPPGLPPLEAIARLRAQGAFIAVAHPFDRLRKWHWELSALLEILPLVDAIETFNARSFSARFNTRADDFARQHGCAAIVGSDAHTTFELGRARMQLPDFADRQGLIAALPHARTQVALSPPWIHLTSRYAVWWKKLVRT